MPKIVGPLKKCQLCGEMFVDKIEGGRAVICLECWHAEMCSAVALELPPCETDCETCTLECRENRGRRASFNPDKKGG